MTVAAKPWMMFYPQDWRADESLRLCSLAARGLWVEMLALMHRSERYGYLLVKGKAPTDRQLAALVGGADEDVSAGLAELEEFEVFSRDRNGTIYSRRMIRDEKRSKTATKNGAKGGNPKLRKQKEKSASDNQEDKAKVEGSLKPQSPESIDHSSVDESTGGEGPPFDPVKAMFDAGVGLLTAAGVPDRQARSLIGKWRGQVGDDEVRLAIGEAQIARISDPVPWLTRRCASKGKAHTNPDDAYLARTIEDIRQRTEWEKNHPKAAAGATR